MSIYTKLSQVQNELKAPKSQFNKFGNYKYRSCEDILEAVKPLCLKHELTLILSDEIVLTGERYYVKAIARLYDDKENIEVTAYAREEEAKKGMDGSQITGASSSYARKYALNGLFNIDDTKDSDTTNEHDKTNKSDNKTIKVTTPSTTQDETKKQQDAENKVIDKVKLASIEAELKRTGVPAKQITDRYKVFELKELTIVDYSKAMSVLAKMADRPKTDLGL